MIYAIDRVAVSIGGFDIYWYGILIFTGMICAYFLANHEMVKKGFSDETLTEMMVYIIVFSLVGARLYFVLFNLDYYLLHPLDIIKVWEGGMAIHGGLIGGVLAGYYYTRKNNYSFFQFGDMLMPSVLLGQAIGRWGNFINQEAHGGPVSRAFLETLRLPEFIINQMYIDGVYYHPTFLYESIWNVVGIFILMRLRPKLKIGQTFLLYLIYYSIGRFFIEGMRTDSLMILDLLRTAQVMSLSLIVLAIIVWIYRNKKYDLPVYGNVHGNFNTFNKKQRATVKQNTKKKKRK